MVHFCIKISALQLTAVNETSHMLQIIEQADFRIHLATTVGTNDS